MAGAKGQAGAEARRLRRARRGSRLDRLLPPLRDRLRVLLTVSRTRRAGSSCTGRAALYRNEPWRGDARRVKIARAPAVADQDSPDGAFAAELACKSAKVVYDVVQPKVYGRTGFWPSRGELHAQ